LSIATTHLGYTCRKQARGRSAFIVAYERSLYLLRLLLLSLTPALLDGPTLSQPELVTSSSLFLPQATPLRTPPLPPTSTGTTCRLQQSNSIGGQKGPRCLNQHRWHRHRLCCLGRRRHSLGRRPVRRVESSIGSQEGPRCLNQHRWHRHRLCCLGRRRHSFGRCTLQTGLRCLNQNWRHLRRFCCLRRRRRCL
jgi:hypothetical protein